MNSPKAQETINCYDSFNIVELGLHLNPKANRSRTIWVGILLPHKPEARNGQLQTRSPERLAALPYFWPVKQLCEVTGLSPVWVSSEPCPAEEF